MNSLNIEMAIAIIAAISASVAIILLLWAARVFRTAAAEAARAETAASRAIELASEASRLASKAASEANRAISIEVSVNGNS